MALGRSRQIGFIHSALDAKCAGANAACANALEAARRRCLHSVAAGTQNGARAGGESPMIDLYYWPTPNSHKITMFLEETAMPYTIMPVNIGKGEQFKPEFLAISPNNRMPAIVDHSPLERGAPISVFESGAILLYLAEKSERFIPNESRGRVEGLRWLFLPVGGLGPMLGQNHHFTRYAPEQIPYAIDRYVKETNRLYGVLNQGLCA